MTKKNQENNKQFTITKKIAKHGSQAIIVVPRVLQEQLQPGTIAKITIDVIKENGNSEEEEVKVRGEGR
jgi:uncharacterized protein (DUF1015 family)